MKRDIFVTRRTRQKTPHSTKLPERTRPSMYQQQQDRVGTFRARLQEVYVEVFDQLGVFGVLVDITLHGEPVKIVYPGVVVEVFRPFVGRAYLLSRCQQKDRVLRVRRTIAISRIDDNWSSWESCVF